MTEHVSRGLGWFEIARLGLVQSALGAIVVLTTSTLNRVMVVELGLMASLPAGLVAWHYAVQLSRPLWGHGSDAGYSRTPWIIGGMGVLALGALLAVNATILAGSDPFAGTALGIVAFTLIGAGVGASGTSLLALLATAVVPERRPAAAAITWIMMIVGIVFTAATASQLLDPYSPERLALVASGIVGVAFLVTLIAVMGIERALPSRPLTRADASLRQTLSEIWSETLARRFTIFVFVSMLAYSAQDLILEPFAGLVFGYSLGQSTGLAGVQHAGVLVGMVAVGLIGTFMAGERTRWLRDSTVAGCIASTVALVALAVGGFTGPTWPLGLTVFALGLANGIFAVSAIGLMMTFAGEGQASREGSRMGVWGAAQAIAFGAGGFAGASGLDLARSLVESTPQAFAVVFCAEAGLFLVAASLAAGLLSNPIRGNGHSAPLAMHAGD